MLPAALVLVLATALSGCVAALGAAGAAGTAARAGMSDRGFSGAVDDVQITRSVIEALSDSAYDMRDVDVDTFDARVMLTGTVGNDEARIAAGRIAGDMSSVGTVHNGLRVGSPTGLVQKTEDGRITTQVRAKLEADGGIEGKNVELKTHDGTVYLLGVAGTPSERAAMIDKARTTGGVRQVVSFIQVDAPATSKGS
jgi:osmotically-inducible protein OsmY